MKNSMKKPLQIFKVLAHAIGIIDIMLNLILPVLNTKKFGLSFFSIVAILLYVYALLCENGYIKSVAEYGEDGKSFRYETSVPSLQIGFVRIVQLLFYALFKKNEIIILNFAILLIVDLLFVVVLLLDGSSYYYESVEENGDD